MSTNGRSRSTAIKLFVLILPPLAIILKDRKVKSRNILIGIISTLMFWIPGKSVQINLFYYNLIYFYSFHVSGVIFAYWICFIKADPRHHHPKISNSSKTTESSVKQPKPIYPKANYILSLPIDIKSVIVHFPPEEHVQICESAQFFSNIDCSTNPYESSSCIV